MKFYEDQHKLAAYLERHPDAEWQWGEIAIWHQGGTPDTFLTPSEAVAAGHPIRPVLRYGLPSHLQSEIRNPDNLTEEQICEGGKYRAVTNDDSCNQVHQVWTGEKWAAGDPAKKFFTGHGSTYRLPATVPWPDWEREEAARPDPKDARIAELEEGLADSLEEQNRRDQRIEALKIYTGKLEAQLATSPWRPMSEVPNEEDADADGFILGMRKDRTIGLIKRVHFKAHASSKAFEVWMSAPKFHGWPDPLADLLKMHGVAVTPELAAALNAWKGVEK